MSRSLAPAPLTTCTSVSRGGSVSHRRVSGVMEALPPEDYTRIEFVDATTGTNVPKQFVPAVEKGFRPSRANDGALTGHRISGVRFVLQDGGRTTRLIHASTRSSWPRRARSRGFTKAGQWLILEPVMSVEVSTRLDFYIYMLI